MLATRSCKSATRFSTRFAAGWNKLNVVLSVKVGLCSGFGLDSGECMGDVVEKNLVDQVGCI